MHGSESFLEHTVAAAEAYDVAHDLLGTAELAARFPQFALAGDEQGCYEPGAGFVRPERAVEAQLRLARELGATLALGERVLGYDDHGTHVVVRTTNRTVEASDPGGHRRAVGRGAGPRAGIGCAGPSSGALLVRPARPVVVPRAS